MNFGQLKDRVADWLGASGQTDRISRDQLGDLINIRIRKLLRSTRLRFGEVSFDYALVGGEDAIGLSTRFLYPITVSSQISGAAPVPVEIFQSVDKFRRKYPLTSTGSPATGDQPLGVCYIEGEWKIAPVPTGQCSVIGTIYQLPADFVTDDEEGDIIEGAWDVLLWGSLADASKYIFNDPRGPEWEAAFREARATLIANHGYVAAQPSQMEIPA